MSLSGINFSGLGSGIDTESIISQLIKLQQRPATKLLERKQQIQEQQTGLGQITALLSGMQAAASSLDNATSFSLVKAASSDDKVATVTAESGAQAGSHTLQVMQLAQAHRLGSTTLSSQTEALGVSGQIVINGKAINVAATDTLQSLAAGINGAQVGVNASIVSTATDRYTLVLTAKETGATNAIRLSDTAGGTILQAKLGLIGASVAISHAITNGAASDLFTDSSTSVGTLLGLTAPQTGSIRINNKRVDIDFATDSLSDIAGKINAANIQGVTAAVVSTRDSSGASRMQLQITGSAGTPVFTDAANVLTNLGILANAPANTLSTAKDAQFVIDGLSATRSSNTVKDVLTGVTFNLLQDAGSPTTTLSVSPDTETIKTSIKTFVDQYNQLVRTVNNLTSFDPQTLEGGPLLGDVMVQSALNSVTDIMTGAVAGLEGRYSMLADVGITLDGTGILNIKEADLDTALSSDLEQVAKIFRAVGVSTDSSISFVSSTDKTRYGGAGFAVSITQVATQAGLTAGTAHTVNNNASVETLTFTGGQFGASGKTLLIEASSTLDDIIARINGDETLSAVLTASKLNNRLTLTARQYGSAYAFSVVSSQAAAANNSGIGNTAVSAQAVDVSGTINGESATGKGQFLTGNAGNPYTEGLQVRVTATTTGDHGTITFTKGLADQVKYYAQGATDFLNGSLTLYSNSLSQQAEDIDDQIKSLQEHLKNEETALRLRFSAMDAAVARIRAAGAGLSGLISLSTTGSSSSSS